MDDKIPLTQTDEILLFESERVMRKVIRATFFASCLKFYHFNNKKSESPKKGTRVIKPVILKKLNSELNDLQNSKKEINSTTFISENSLAKS